MQSVLLQGVKVSPGNAGFSQWLLWRVLANCSQTMPITYLWEFTHLNELVLPPLVQPNSIQNICFMLLLWYFPSMAYIKRTQHILVYTRKAMLCLILSPMFSSSHSLSSLRTRIKSHIANNKIIVRIPSPFELETVNFWENRILNFWFPNLLFM